MKLQRKKSLKEMSRHLAISKSWMYGDPHRTVTDKNLREMYRISTFAGYCLQLG